MWETIRGYLTFNRKERYGVLFLLVMVLALFILPYFFRPKSGEPDPELYLQMKRTLDKSGFKNRDSLSLYDEESHADPKKFRIAGTHVFQTKAESFIFDPNTIPEEEWKRLGLSDRVIQTIFHYLGKGGHFHKAEDLKKLYGLKNADYERLFPYVHG